MEDLDLRPLVEPYRAAAAVVNQWMDRRAHIEHDPLLPLFYALLDEFAWCSEPSRDPARDVGRWVEREDAERARYNPPKPSGEPLL